jgi:hypothetical protein
MEQREDEADRKAEEEAAAAAVHAAIQAAAVVVEEEGVVEGGVNFDTEDAIYRAMMAAVQAQPDTAGTPEQPRSEAQPKAVLATAPARRRLNTAFADDEEEVLPQRKFIPIRSVLERRAFSAQQCSNECNAPFHREQCTWMHQPCCKPFC